MLDTASIEGGYCCNTRLDGYIVDVVSGHWIAVMDRTVLAFNPEWLTHHGAKDHWDTLTTPRGPKG